MAMEICVIYTKSIQSTITHLLCISVKMAATAIALKRDQLPPLTSLGESHSNKVGLHGAVQILSQGVQGVTHPPNQPESPLFLP